ncbi:MAG: hypothetical protein K2Q18_12385 [Bdellovibrionales bacterium]|nr:hypothetical protein [Bdellovibrionales bacterium]
MRLLAIFFAILSIYDANAKLSLTPRWRESYGGETSIAEFKNIAYDVFKGLSDESYEKVNNLKKAAVIETIKNSVVVCKSDLVLEGVSKDAINYPLRIPQAIEFDCKKWDSYSYSKQLSLVVHEYLFLSFIDDSGYDISSQVIKMYVNDNYDYQKGSLLRTAVSTCNVDFYNAIIPQMPVAQAKLVIDSTLLRLTLRDGCPIFKDLIDRGFTTGYEQFLYDELALAIAEAIEILKVDPKTASPDNYQSDPAFRKAILADRIAILDLFYGKKINLESLVLNQTYPYNIFSPDYLDKFNCRGSNLLHVAFYAYSKAGVDFENQTVFIDLAEALMRAGFQIDKKNECGLTPKDIMRMEHN